MKTRLILAAVLFIFGCSYSAISSAFGHGHGGFGHHGFGGGYYGGPGFGLYFGAPAYPYYYNRYPYYAPPPVITVPAAPPVYIQQAPPAPVQQSIAPGYWYYCNNPQGYYPYIRECPSGWQQVSPTPTR